MPLHEYLEQKRRQNIAQLNASGACHICGSTCRNAQGFRHFLDIENNTALVDGGNYNEHSMVRPPNLAAMRTCSCFGQSKDDPDYWPYSLRVCDRCIEDDKGIGRIRTCGICGIVACDEKCGHAELIECTDCQAWNNLGCIECRRFSDFQEMDIFRGVGQAQNHGGRGGHEPRITRICAQCLDQSTPWVKHDFVCRRFRCETRLVNSDFAEQKRYKTFGSSPLNLLPEDGLAAIVSFLSGRDLRQLYQTCSALCTVAERVAREKVQNVNETLPTGPIVVSTRKDRFGDAPRKWTRLGGTNDHSLRAPDDEKSWVGVYHYIEKISQDIFGFGFQMDIAAAGRRDKEVVGRFINQNPGEKFAFGQVYETVENEDRLVAVGSPLPGVQVRGGTALVSGEEMKQLALVQTMPNAIVASSESMATGTHRVLCRLFVPGVDGSRGNRDAASIKLGSIGLICANKSDGPANSWTHRQDLTEPFITEHQMFGVEYNADERALVIHNNSHTNRSRRFASTRTKVAESAGDLYIGVELTAKVTSVQQAIVTVRNCTEAEWNHFVESTAQTRASTETTS